MVPAFLKADILLFLGDSCAFSVLAGPEPAIGPKSEVGG